MRKLIQYKHLTKGLSAKLVPTAAAVALTLSAGLARADDTEIFFGRSSAQPNVLLILDTSGSMASFDGGSTRRMDRMKQALNELLSTTNDINVGLLTYHRDGTFSHAVKPITEHRAELLETIDSLYHAGQTKSVRALHRGMRYFQGAELTYDLQRSNDGPFAYNCDNPENTEGCYGGPKAGEQYSIEHLTREWVRLPHPDTYVGGETIRHEHCTLDNLSHPSCINENIEGPATYNSPIVSECQSNHIVFLTDGQPTNDADIQNIVKDELGIASCANINDAGFPYGGRCGADITAYMAGNDQTDVFDSKVITHTIGFNLTEDYKWLESVSTAGRGTHHTADSAQSLLEAFENIIGVAQKELNTFVAPAITVDSFSGLSHRDDVYLGPFKPSARSNWSGNLKRYQYTGNPLELRDANGNPAVDTENSKFFDTAQSWWSDTPDGNTVTLGGAAHKLDADDRRVYTHLAGNTLADPENRVHENNDSITPAMLGLTTEDRDQVLQWTRGVDVHDYDNDLSTTTRRQMGDALHSNPTLVTYGKIDNQPESVVFVGTNQGYLHAIDSITGKELFSFIPKELLSNLEAFYTDERRVNKLYGLDGSIATWVQDNNYDGAINNNDHAYLYVGMRRGGNNYYALDVTKKDNPKHLWTIKGGPDGDTDFAELGQSWSKPTVRSIMVNNKETKVLIFGGGYDAMQDNSAIRSPDTVGNALFVVNAETGELIWKATQKNFPAMQYSIPSDPNIIDINGDGMADQIYVGDLGGQVWRFDLNNPQSKKIATGGVIASFANDNAEGFRKFFYRPDIALINDTENNSKFLSVSIGSGNRAHPLGDTVENRFYMFRQHSILTAPAGYGMLDPITNKYRPVTEKDLIDASNNQIESADTVVAQQARQALADAQGWLVQLTEPGEKVLSHSLTIENGVNFTTYLPHATLGEDICSPSIGQSRLYRMSVIDASPTADGISAENRYSDIPGGGIASSVNLFFTESGDAYIQENLRTVDATDLNLLRRTFWAEQDE